MSLRQIVRAPFSIEPRELLGAVGAVLAVNLIGASGVVFTTPESEWFQSLTLPWFYPPTWLFGVVWTLLFTLIGIAAYLVYRQGLDKRAVRVALGLFGLQLAVNVTWSPVFFELQAPGLALGIICLLWLLVAATIGAFDRVDRRAALLLGPYLVWISFAGLLNGSIWLLN